MQEVPPIRPDGLQLDEHRQFQERFWTIERAAWIVFGMIVIAALAGAFGAGGRLPQQRQRWLAPQSSIRALRDGKLPTR